MSETTGVCLVSVFQVVSFEVASNWDSRYDDRDGGANQGPVARSMVSANHWFGRIPIRFYRS